MYQVCEYNGETREYMPVTELLEWTAAVAEMRRLKMFDKKLVHRAVIPVNVENTSGEALHVDEA